MSTIEGTEPRSATWADHLARACGNHPDLAAVFESPSGRLALLLRHTLVPLMEERPAWLTETRASARRIIGDLRASGVTRKVLVVQWLEIAKADDILWSWTCRYEADPIRRAQLTGLARRYVLDDLFLADRLARRKPAPAPPPVKPLPDVLTDPSLSPETPASEALDDWRRPLIRWYRAMEPCWRSATPLLRCKLVLETHVWLAAHVVGDVHFPPPQVGAVELTEKCDLARMLALRIPPDEREDWRSWVQLVLADLRQALSRPVEERDERWGRWLFLIPYSVPAPRPRRPTTGLLPSAFPPDSGESRHDAAA